MRPAITLLCTDTPWVSPCVLLCVLEKGKNVCHPALTCTGKRQDEPLHCTKMGTGMRQTSHPTALICTVIRRDQLSHCIDRQDEARPAMTHTSTDMLWGMAKADIPSHFTEMHWGKADQAMHCTALR
eukprot:1160361-Pelagomonas_calceolata.AAC.2